MARSLYSKYRIAATAFSIAISIGLTIYLLYFSFQTVSLYSWHPAFMSLGYVLFMTDAIMLLPKDNILFFLFPKLQNTSRFQHVLLQAGGAICTLVGFVTIIVNKNQSRRATHFTSYHAIIGLVAVICTFVTCVGGIFTYFAFNLKNWIKPSYNKFGHAVIGILTFAIGIVAQATGFYTRSFESSTDLCIQIICTVLLSLSALIALEGALKSTYSRLKQIMF